MKFRRSLFLLPLMALFFVVTGSCQHKGVLRYPKIGSNGKTVEVKGKNGQALQTTTVALDKNGRVKKKSRLKFW